MTILYFTINYDNAYSNKDRGKGRIIKSKDIINLNEESNNYRNSTICNSNKSIIKSSYVEGNVQEVNVDLTKENIFETDIEKIDKNISKQTIYDNNNIKLKSILTDNSVTEMSEIYAILIQEESEYELIDKLITKVNMFKNKIQDLIHTRTSIYNHDFNHDYKIEYKDTKEKEVIL